MDEKADRPENVPGTGIEDQTTPADLPRSLEIPVPRKLLQQALAMVIYAALKTNDACPTNPLDRSGVTFPGHDSGDGAEYEVTVRRVKEGNSDATIADQT